MDEPKHVCYICHVNKVDINYSMCPQCHDEVENEIKNAYESPEASRPKFFSKNTHSMFISSSNIGSDAFGSQQFK